AMKLNSITTALTLLAASSSAAPAASKRANSCGLSTFVVDTSSQAVASHCQTLVSLLQTSTFPSYIWGLDGSWKSVLTYDTCSFSARTTRNGQGQIGNEDVFDLLRDTVRDTNRGGSVGAKGVMSCGGVEVEWKV
ncbi:hypothetical protein QBC43DRAFT_181629, partial [Cladorrhinum sp. PSN259]